MPAPFIDVGSISQLHELYGAGKPQHPLITVIDPGTTRKGHREEIATYRLGLYTIFCKRSNGYLKYGRSHYDFSEGSLLFTSPGQVMTANPESERGWALFFHPDLVNAGTLGVRIREYTFFHYEVNEALHLSEEEKCTIAACIANIRKEYVLPIDKHSNHLIRTNLELLLGYCSRFYDRQFYTREKVNTDTVQRFETLLNNYFNGESLIDSGLPAVSYFADQMHLSPNYLSDLLHRFTGKTTQEHIHLEVVIKAKSLLWGTDRSISEIAYELGFEYPSQFTRLFKNKTGYSPSDYRRKNDSI